MGYIRANLTFFLLATLIVVSVAGYLWWQSGFTLEFSKFFAANPEPSDCEFVGGICAASCSGSTQQIAEACARPDFVCCIPTPVPVAPPPSEPVYTCQDVAGQQCVLGSTCPQSYPNGSGTCQNGYTCCKFASPSIPLILFLGLNGCPSHAPGENWRPQPSKSITET